MCLFQLFLFLKYSDLNNGYNVNAGKKIIYFLLLQTSSTRDYEVYKKKEISYMKLLNNKYYND